MLTQLSNWWSRFNPDSSPDWRPVLRNSSWLFVEKAIRWTTTLIVGAWMARHLGPQDFGALNYALSFPALFAGLVLFGVENIVVRDLVRAPGRGETLLGQVCVLRLAGGVLAGALALLVAVTLRQGQADAALIMIVVLIPLAASGDVFDLWFQAHLHARAAAGARAVALLVVTAGRLALIMLDAPVRAFAWLAVVEAAVTSVGLAIAFSRMHGRWRLVRLVWNQVRPLLVESWPNVVSGFAMMLYMRVDRILLGYFVGESAVGVYSAGATLVEVWYFVPVAIVASATPMLTRLRAQDPQSYWRRLGELARALSALAWGLAVILALAATWLTDLMYGPSFTEARMVVTVLAFGLPMAFLGVAVSPWYLNEKFLAIAMRRHLGGAVVSVALGSLLIPRWGMTGAAVTTLASFTVAHVAGNAWDSRTIDVFRLQWRAFFLLNPVSAK